MREANIAVVIPLFNRATTVLHTLSSVANQTTPPRQIIVVDDGSVDDSAAAVSQWLAEGKQSWKTNLIRQTNQGASAARNRGLAQIEDCDYVAFLDSDDRWPADFLSRAVARLEADKTAIAATADRQFHRKSGTRPGFRSSRQIERHPSVWLMTHDGGIASCTLFRTDAIRNLGEFDTSLDTGQDVELFLRLSKTGRWLHIPGDPVNFYVGFSTLQGEESNLSFKYSDRKHRWAQIREHFIFQQEGHQQVPRKVYLRALARSWHKAGCDYQVQGRFESAAVCFQKSAAYQPFTVANFWRRARLIAHTFLYRATDQSNQLPTV